jgi:anti-sigma regulatory factor (Ser/Thr protein kinase)
MRRLVDAGATEERCEEPSMSRPSQESLHRDPGDRDASALPAATKDRTAADPRTTDASSDAPPGVEMHSTAPLVTLQLRMEADAIAGADPVPAIMQLLSDVAIGVHHRSDVFAIVRELVTNAIDHGLLGLDSELKTTQDGFMEYYRLREARLRSLRGGHITLRIARERTRAPGCDALRIAVADSGPGFDHRKELARTNDPNCLGQGARGRGIGMLRSLCVQLTYHGAGNAAEVVYLLMPASA